MIRERLLELREQRALLVAHAAQERVDLDVLVERAESVAIWVERGRAAVAYLKAHPGWVAAGVALLVALRPRKALKWLATGMSLWRGWRSLRDAVDRLGPRAQRARSN